MTTPYDPALDLRAARAQYFRDNDFGPDGGYSARWVTVTKVGPIPLGFPNSAARVEAVRFHDLHHLVTGYSTDLLGEAEIGAWEVASGCDRFLVAWVLNLLAMAYGILLGPRRVFAAFVRGRRSRNLYRTSFDDTLLDRGLGDVIGELGTGVQATPTAADRAAFVGWLALTWGTALGVPVAALLVVVSMW